MPFLPGSNAVLERSFSQSGNDTSYSVWSYYLPALILLILGGPSLALWVAPYMPWLFWTSLGLLGASLLGFLFLRRPASYPVAILMMLSATVFLGCFNARYNTPFFSIAFLGLCVIATIVAISFHIRHVVRERKIAQTPPEETLEKSDEQKSLSMV